MAMHRFHADLLFPMFGSTNTAGGAGAAVVCVCDAFAAFAGFTCPGDVIVTDHKHASHAPASEPEPEMTHLYLAELNSRGREVAPCLNGSSMMFYQVTG